MTDTVICTDLGFAQDGKFNGKVDTWCPNDDAINVSSNRDLQAAELERD